MSLREEQSKFARLVADLINHIYDEGYEVTLGDAYRDPRVHGAYGEKMSYSAAASFHKKKLAIDLNLFKDGAFLHSTEHHRKFGEYWMNLDPKCSWGGNWNDGNHYSYGEGK